MAEPARLYSVAMHFGLRIFTAVVGGIATVIAIQSLLLEKNFPLALAAWGGMILCLGIFFRIIWRTRQILLDGDHLLIGRASRRRRIGIGDVLSCEYPWWVYSDRFAAPLELTLRDGDTVTFFPEVGAAELIAARRRDAQQA